MLTFEEFFQKKKIDLSQLKTAEPGLFAEFSKHYPLMGEKSFDHTKKYYFNYLRRTYPLLVSAKPHPVQAEDISNMAVQGIAVAAAQNLNDAIERPKFKEDHLMELSEPSVPEKDISLAEAESVILETTSETEVSKPAFKPRFNLKSISKPKEEIVSDAVTENAEAATKPAFKPRFNPKNIPKTEAETKLELEDQQPETEPNTPVYKPRFNMQNLEKEGIKTASDKSESVLEAQHVPEIPQLPSKQIEPIVKPAFKPRFNPKNIPKQVTEPVQEVASQNPKIKNETLVPETNPNLQLDDNQSLKSVLEHNASDSNVNPDLPEPEKQSEKTVYKPRFQMKNIPKPPANLD